MNHEPRLLIDISAAVNQRAGIGRYAREITRQLLPMMGAMPTRIWYAADPGPFDSDLLSEAPWTTVPVATSLLPRRLVDRTVIRHRIPIGRMLRTGHASAVYSPDFTAPPVGGAAVHITVHDLAWFHPEAATPPSLSRFLEPVVQRTVHRATTVFTVSDAIRSEVIERYRVDPGMVVVAPNAAAAHFFAHFDRGTASEPSIATFGTFVLFVGTIEPRKNLVMLFEAVRYLPDEIRLILVGRRGYRADEILDRVRRLGLESRVIELGFVDDARLRALMATSLAVVYPSRYEGFGLPVIEALATGSPVACSNLPVFEEVAGSQARYFDPRDPVAIAAAIEAAISDGRDDAAIVDSRIAQARMFDWAASAAIVQQRLIETAR